MTLHIPVKIFQQMCYYVAACAPAEVTGIGTLQLSADHREFVVTEIFLPEQHTSESFCTFAEGALNDIIYDLVQQNRAHELKFRWHSHGHAAVFWSQIDQKDIQEWTSDFLVSMVMNTRQEYKVRLDLFQPFVVEEIPLDLVIDYPDDLELRRLCNRQAAVRVQYHKSAPKRVEM